MNTRSIRRPPRVGVKSQPVAVAEAGFFAQIWKMAEFCGKSGLARALQSFLHTGGMVPPVLQGEIK